MQELKNRIQKEAKVISNSILKVDNFLNHQIDWKLTENIGLEFRKIFNNIKIDKIVTVEASGICIGLMTAKAFDIPLIFAKKKKPSTLTDFYSTEVFSFTKQQINSIHISKEFLIKDENILVVDDFLANGNTILGLIEIIKKAKANLCGVGIVIEKAFQEGGKKIRDKGIKLESLAMIKKLENGNVYFKE